MLKRAREHRRKIEEMAGEKDTTHDYWLKEAENFEEQAKEVEKILERLGLGRDFDEE